MHTVHIIATVFLTCLIYTSSVEGYGTGAPTQACVTLTPGHVYDGNVSLPIDPQESESPYTLQVDKETVQQGQTVEVTINGGVFQGFLLQARLSDESSTTPVGMFTTIPDDIAQHRQCTAAADSVTHTSPADKPDGTSFTWTAPDKEFGDVYFIATVAQVHDDFWVGIKSSVVESGAAWVVPSISSMVTLLIAAFLLH